MLDVNSRTLELIAEFQRKLVALAAGFEAWRTAFRVAHADAVLAPGEDEALHPARKWDHYKTEFITAGPQWSKLESKHDLGRIFLDYCLGRVCGHPGPLALESLKFAVRILLIRPDLARATPGEFSLILRVQGLMQPHAVPDLVPQARWNRLLLRSIAALKRKPELVDEYRRVTELIERNPDHPLAKGFRSAVAIGEAMEQARMQQPVGVDGLGRPHGESLLVTVAA